MENIMNFEIINLDEIVETGSMESAEGGNTCCLLIAGGCSSKKEEKKELESEN